MKAELADECDYVREASFMKTFGSSEYLGHDPRFKVPWVWDGSTSTVLVMEHVDGVSVGEANAKNLTETDRNDVRFCIPKSFLSYSRFSIAIDFLAHHRVMPQRTLRVPDDADRSQLDQLSLEPHDSTS
jgi:hypothetical protein